MSSDDKWLSAMLRRPQPDEAAPDCLDAETLAAWADGALTARQAAAAELHASVCARCTAVLAGIESTSHAASVPEHAPRRARVLRWLVPLSAVATAIAIWVAVPDRDTRPANQPAVMQEPAGQALDDTAQQSPAAEPQLSSPSTQTAEKREAVLPQRNDVPSVRERAATESRDMTKADSPPTAAPLESAPRVSPPPSTSQSTRAAGAAADAASAPAATLARRFEFSPSPIGSISPSNTLHRWRVVPPMSIERSLDGGTSWSPVAPLPAATSAGPEQTTITMLRAGDDRRVVATTSDGRTFYTTDAGASWTLVQENRPVPF